MKEVYIKVMTVAKSMNYKFHILAYRRFLQLIGYSGDSTSRNLFRLFQAASYSVFVVFFVNLFSIGKSSFGEWGDFFGGVLNPLLTFLTFMGLLLTIILQNKELRQARVEARRSADALVSQNKTIEKQSFEQTVFNMLGLQQQIINSIDLFETNTQRTTAGRDCFEVFYNRFEKSAKNSGVNFHGEICDLEKEQQRINNAWRVFWKTHQSELGHYFRYLYNIIRFIDEKKYDTATYMRIVRAQLSDQELLILFYNCLSVHGQEKFKPLVETYALFDNLPTSKLINKNHTLLYKAKAFGEFNA
ncbi:putative phage abortive infection protein [Aeromonas salmonicida]|uniref:putative phage abortive infection protein n=1 Tax=Aeromonas salmonicida TaxID=645 RepID=UPI003D1B1CDF